MIRNSNLNNIPTRKQSVNNIKNNSNQNYSAPRNTTTIHLEKNYTSAILHRQNEEKEDFQTSNKSNRPKQEQSSLSTEVYRLLETFSPRPGDTDDLNSSKLNHKLVEEKDSLPSSFNLDKILDKYGDSNNILQLILSSKLEEDRRRAEEAKLKQRELDYLMSSKEDVCQSCNKKKSAGNERIETVKVSESKGKEKYNNRDIFLNDSSLPSNTKMQDIDYLPFDSLTKRKIRYNDDEEEEQQRQQQQLFLPSNVSNYNKLEDYFSTLPSASLISPTQYDAHGFQTKKRHSSLNQIYASSLASISPGGSGGSALSTPSELPTRQLQSLDYLTSRRSSLGPFSPSLYQRTSYSSEKLSTVENLQPNTLPPISVSPSLLQGQPKSHDRDESLASPLSSSQVLQSNTYMSYNQNRSSTPPNDYKRFKSLPALDSFEASIMESLPFDDKSECTGNTTADKANEFSRAKGRYSESRNVIAQDVSSLSLKKQTTTKHSSRQQSTQSKTQLNKAKQPTIPSSNFLKNSSEASSSSNKLPLPPNPSSSRQSASDASSLRPRRRRREMQAITMIIETREFPYNDEYVWKNNGNTIHKSSGQKSIYYKCSNSNAGCPVNKTLTFKDNGEYLIKYRGSHLEECSKIKRIVNV